MKRSQRYRGRKSSPERGLSLPGLDPAELIEHFLGAGVIAGGLDGRQIAIQISHGGFHLLEIQPRSRRRPTKLGWKPRTTQVAGKYEMIVRIERKSILGLGVLPVLFGPHSSVRIQSIGD